MASSIFFTGRVISVPGSYSTVDASGLNSVGLGATGIVAVLATGEGGRPVSDITKARDLPRYKSAQRMREAFRGGDLREVGNFLFGPAKDPDILAGAQEVVVCKANPATKSSLMLQQGGTDALLLESRDFGAATDQINWLQQPGSSQGKLVSIVFENISQGADNIGGDILSTLSYVKGARGYDTMVADLDSAGNVTANGTKTAPGEAALVDGAIGTNTAEILSSNAGDTNTVILFGIDSVSGLPVSETLTLSGTTPVVGSVVWTAAKLLGVWIDQTVATLGTVTVRNVGAGANVFTVPAATEAEGVRKLDNGFVNKTNVNLELDAAGTPQVLLFGRNQAGGVLKEAVTMTGTTPVPSAGPDYAYIDYLVTGEVAGGVNLIASAESAKSLANVQKTLQQASDYFNARQNLAGDEGFFWDLTSGSVNQLMVEMDLLTSTNIADPAQLSLTADLEALADWINANSSLISATIPANSPGVPDDTPSPVFLSGGGEGVASFGEYQAALNLLKGLRINTVLDMSGDPAVAAAVDAHIAFMGGIGRSERDGFVGLMGLDTTPGPNFNTPLSPPVPASKTSVQDQIIALNTKNIRACPQFIEQYSADGVLTEYPSTYAAAIAAGSQAGSPVGTSLTYKFMDVVSFRQDATWNPTDDAEEMVQSGALFMEFVDGVGSRWVRNVTTHLSSDNIAFVEGSVVEATNTAVFNLRTNLEFAVGKRGFAGTVSATRGIAVNTLGILTDTLILTGYRNLDLELITDVIEISLDIAPIIPINFVKTTVHLVTLQQLQAR